MPEQQDLIADRYRLEEPVAGGGMGEVWRATDTVLGREVAVKILSDRMADDAGFTARFRDEARTMAGLRHPGVAAVFDYGESGGDTPAYLVMAYVEGEPLDRHIAAAGRLGAAETASIVAQAGRALHAVHGAGVVHRDVKPGNLILQADGTVVLVDFGVARSPRSAQLTGVDEIIGTAAYMAPEQVTKDPLTPATDVYALGAVAYQCLAGRPPFAGDNALTVALHHLNDQPPPLPDDVPAGIRDLVTRAMAKNPADRFPSAAAMAAAADALPHDDAALAAGPRAAAEAGASATSHTAVLARPGPSAGGPAGPPPHGGPAGRPSRRVWLTLLLILAAVAIALAIAGLTGNLRLPGTAPATPGPTVVPTTGRGTGAPAQPGGTPTGAPQQTGGTRPTGGARTTTPAPAATTGGAPGATTPAATSTGGTGTGGTGGTGTGATGSPPGQLVPASPPASG